MKKLLIEPFHFFRVQEKHFTSTQPCHVKIEEYLLSDTNNTKLTSGQREVLFPVVPKHVTPTAKMAISSDMIHLYYLTFTLTHQSNITSVMTLVMKDSSLKSHNSRNNMMRKWCLD